MIATRENAEIVIRRRAMKKDKSDKKLTITEAAKKLGVTRQTIHHAIQEGLLDAKKEEVVQEAWLIPASALANYRKLYSRKRAKKR